MPENRVLFRIGADAWTLAGACLVLGAVLLVIGGGLLAVLLVRHGHTRQLEGYEASRVAFNADKLGEVRPIHGPAIGVERRVSFTIGDLRRAHRAGNRLVFWGAPLMLMTLSAAIGLVSFAGALWTRDNVFLVGYLVLVPIFLIGAFMPWAALHTELE